MESRRGIRTRHGHSIWGRKSYPWLDNLQPREINNPHRLPNAMGAGEMIILLTLHGIEQRYYIAAPYGRQYYVFLQLANNRQIHIYGDATKHDQVFWTKVFRASDAVTTIKGMMRRHQLSTLLQNNKSTLVRTSSSVYFSLTLYFSDRLMSWSRVSFYSSSYWLHKTHLHSPDISQQLMGSVITTLSVICVHNTLWTNYWTHRLEDHPKSKKQKYLFLTGLRSRKDHTQRGILLLPPASGSESGTTTRKQDY